MKQLKQWREDEILDVLRLPCGYVVNKSNNVRDIYAEIHLKNCHKCKKRLAGECHGMGCYHSCVFSSTFPGCQTFERTEEKG